MRYDDTITVPTPEGVEFELTLAGAGSRFVSALVDLAVQFVLLFATFLAVGPWGGLGDAAAALISFVVVLGYDVVFEVFASGRTPGKRLNGLRVVRSGGEPVGFLTSAIRNVLRLVDFLPFAYVIGAVSILWTRRNQRLGDLAAGTLVVRDRVAKRAETPASFFPASETAAWDVSAVTAEEIAAVRRFLERRHQIEDGARTELARTLAQRLRPKVGGVSGELSAEHFLGLLASAKAARGDDSRPMI
jgi:uncharacterized RDD family membrane protein YckC